MKNNYPLPNLLRSAMLVLMLLISQLAISQPCVTPPTDTAGTNASICSNAKYTLGGSIGGSATSATWSTSGTGTFSPGNVFGVASTYTPSAADITAGSVTITLTTDDPDGAGDCVPAVSSMTLTITSLPLSGTYTIDNTIAASCSNFISFATAITYLNTYGISGNVIFNIAPGYTETAPATGLLIIQCGLASGLKSNSSQTITFQKNGAGTNPKITASAGTGISDYVFAIAGSDYVTINGIDISESVSNATATTMMEYGYILYPCNATDGAQNNTIKNCTVTLNKTNTNLPSGIAITNLGGTITSAGGTDSNNKLYSNTITNTYYGIYCIGFAATSPYSLYDQGNEIGAVGQGNTITNFGSGTAAASAAAGIYTKYNNNIIIRGNTINSAGSPANVNSIRGIFADRAMWANTTIENNNVTVAVASGATAVNSYGIYNLSGSRKNRTDAITNTVNINNDTILNCSYPTTGTSNFSAIKNFVDMDLTPADSLSAVNVNINNNTIKNNTSGSNTTIAATNDYGYVLIFNQCTSDNLNINSNKILSNIYNGLNNLDIRAIVTGTGIGYGNIANLVQVINVNNDSIVGCTSNTSTAADGGGIYHIDHENPGTSNPALGAGSQYNATGNYMIGVAQTIAKTGKLRGVLVAATNNLAVNVSNSKLSGFTRSTMTGTCIGFQTTVATGINPSSITMNADTVSSISTGGTAADAFTGMSINVAASAAPSTILNMNDNKIFTVTMTSTTTGTFTGLNYNANFAALPPVSNMNRNRITGCTINTTGAGVFIGISNAGLQSTTVSSMDGDTVQTVTLAGSGAFTAISCLNSFTFTINNCRILNNSKTTVAVAGNFIGITAVGLGTSPTGQSMSNNIVKNNTVAGTGSLVCLIAGGGSNVTVTGNTIDLNSKTGANPGNTIDGLTGIRSGGPVIINVTGNTITNLTVPNLSGTSVGGTIYGYRNEAISNVYTENITGNTIDNLTISGAAGTSTSGTIYGISSPNPNDLINRTISGNTISNLKVIAPVSLARIYGISITNNSSISKNKLYTFSSISSDVEEYGIYMSGNGNVTVSNNYVGDLSANNAISPNAITDLYASGQLSYNINLYYNTFKIDAVSGSGNAFGTSNVWISNTPVNVTLKNNILINLSTPGGTGVTGTDGAAVCLRRPDASGVTASYGAGSNNNIYYAGNPGPNHFLYLEGLFVGPTGKQTLSDLQTYATPRETLSKTENVSFTSNTPSNASYLHVNPATPTLAESGGVNISGITTDWDNDIRQGNPGYAGTGFAPDLGADEFGGTTTAPVISNVSITPSGSVCSGTSSRSVSVDVTTATGTISSVVINYSFNGVAQTPVSMTNTSGNTWTGTILASVPSNASVVWSVVATNSNSVNSNYSSSYADDYMTNYTTTSSATPSQICNGSSANLAVSTTNLAFANSTVGAFNAGTVSNGSPFRMGNFSNLPGNPNAGNKVQYIFLGSELQAAGMIAGDITAISFYTQPSSTFPASTPMPKFTVKMGSSTQTGLLSTLFQPDPANTVYGPQTTNYPAIPGIWTLPLTTPYNWDGTSNLLIQICNDSTALPLFGFSNLNVYGDASTFKVSYNSNAAFDACSAASCTALNSGRPTITFTSKRNFDVTSAFNYSWNPGALSGNSISVSPSSSTSYSVTGTDANGCTVTTAPLSLSVNPIPSAPAALNSQQCGTQTPSASVSGTGSNFKWYLVPTGGTALSGQTGSTLVNYTISATTTFYVSELSGVCESPRTMVIAEVNQQPDAITAFASGNNICPYTNVDLTANKTAGPNTYVYTWTASPVSGSGIPTTASGNPATIQATTGGTFIYTVTGTDAGAGCATTSTVSVTYVNPPMIPNPTANPSTICSGGTTTMNANAFIPVNGALASTTLITNNGLQGGANTCFDVKNVSPYPVTLHNFSFGAYIGAVGLTFPQTIYYKAGGMNCITPTPASFPSTWTFIGSTNVTPANFGSNGVNTTIPLDVNITIPPGQTYAFDIQGGYLAYTTATNCSTSVATDGILNLYIDGYGGLAGNSWSARRYTGSVTYDYKISNATYTYSWSPTATLSCPACSTTTASPASTSTYTVQVTEPATSCSNYGNALVTVSPLPSAPTANDSSKCGAGVPTCTVTGTGSSYNWYLTPSGGTPLAGETLDHLTSYIISSTTTFYVSQIVNTCESPRVAVVQNVGGYDPILATNSFPTCFNSVVNLTVAKTGNVFGNNYSYTWSASPYAGSGLSSATPGDPIDGHLDVTPTINNGTYIYTVTGYDSNTNCSAISTVTVTVSNPPVISTVTANPNPVCAGSNLNLTAKTNVTTSFNVPIGTNTNSMTAGNIGPFPSLSEDFKIQYLIKASELTAAGIQPGNINQISFVITAASPGYNWNNYTISMGNTTNSNLTNIWESSLTTVYGPVNVSPISVVVGTRTFTLTTPFAWNGNNLVIDICITNDASNSCTNCYNFGASVFVQYTGTPSYQSVHYYGQADASACATTQVGTLTTTRPNMILNGSYITQGAGTYNWVWNPGALSGNAVVANPINNTSYTVTASNPGSGCSSTQSVSVTANALPAAPVSNGATSQCGTHVPTTSVTGSGGSFSWYTVPTGGTPIPNENGSSLTSYSINTTTTFYVAENDGQCEGPRTVVIANVTQPDSVAASAPASGCANASLSLSASQTSNTNGNIYTYSWSSSAGGGIIGSVPGQNISVTPTTGGTIIYTVTATDGACATTSTVSVSVTAPPHIDNVVSSSNPICAGNPVTLTAKTNVSGNATGTFGSGVITTLAAAGIPFGTGNESQRVQYLILASELQAAGFQAGNITKVTFNVASAAATIGWDAYTIKMGNTSISAFTATTASWENTLTTVYGPVNLLPTAVVVGNNAFTFSNPFIWNGTSNVVVDICWSNDPGNLCGSCSATGTITVNSTTTAGNTVHYNTAANTSLCGATPTGTVAATRPNMILEGNYSVLTAGNYTWQWNPGAINSNVAVVTPVSSPTIYTVKATDPVTTCTSTVAYTQNVSPSPAAPIGTNKSQCGTGVPKCFVTGSGGLFHWFTVPTGGTAIAGENLDHLVTYSISSTTTFYVSEFDGTCEGARGMVIETVNVQPDAVLASGPASVCLGSQVSLSSTKTSNANGNVYTYSWSAAPSAGSGIATTQAGQNIIVTPTTSGTYIYMVTATDIGQGCATTSTASVNVQAPPVTPAAVANPATVCLGSTSALSANAYNVTSGSVTTPMVNTTSVTGGTYWFNLDNTSIYPLVVHNFSVETFTNSTSATVYYKSSPLSSCTSPPTITGYTTIGSASIVGLGTGQYTLIPLNLNVTIPAGQTYSFVVAVNGIMYYGGNGTGTTCPSIGSDLNLVIHEGFGGVITTPVAGRDAVIKVDYDITVGSPTYTYSWSPGASLNNPAIMNPVATPAANTNYTVVVTDPSSNCTSSGSVSVNIGGITSTPVIFATPVTLCNSGITSLSVTNPDGGVIYNWQSSPSGSTNTWTTFGSGVAINSSTLTDSIYFRVYASCGGVGDTSASVLVTVLKPQITGMTGGIRCGAGQVNLQLTGTGNFDWYLNSSGGSAVAVNTATYSPTVGSNTTFWIDAYIGSCHNVLGRQPVSVIVNAPPFITLISSAGTNICNGTPVTLSASSTNDPNYSYSWSTDGGTTIVATGPSYSFTPTSNTTAYVYGIDTTSGTNGGCGTVNSAVLTVNETPATPVLSPDSASICSVGGCTNITVTNPAEGNKHYTVGPGSLSLGLTTTSSGGSMLFTVSQTMTLRTVDMFFATASGSSFGINIADNVTSAIVFNFTGITVHSGTATPDVVTLNATLLPGSYKISLYSDPGTFSNISGASYPYTVPGIISIIGNDQLFLPGYYFDFYNWKVTIPENAVYTWNPGALSGTSQTVCPTVTTTYTVSASFTNGCSSSATAVVGYNPITQPSITPSGPTTICQGGCVSLDAGSGYTSYSWDDGSGIVGTLQNLNACPGITTTYTVTVSNGFCTATASVTVTVQPLAPPAITTTGNSTSICQGNSATLDAGSGYIAYSWSTGESTQTISVDTAGTYTVTVTGVNGCTSSNSVDITVNPSPPPAVITPGGPISLCDDGSNSPVTLIADTTGAGGGGSINWNDLIFGTTGNQYDVYYYDPNITGNTYDFNVTVINSYGCSNTSNNVTVNIISCAVNVTLTDTMLIEGYYIGGGLMNACLFNNAIGTYTSTDADSVFISAMDPITYAEVDKQVGILQTDGTVSVTFGPAVVAGNSYYIRVQHRNSIETWSADPVLMNAVASYDFTSGVNQAYGTVINGIDAMVDVGTPNSEPAKWAFFSGDISDGGNGLGGIIGVQDGIIESTDYGDMENAVNIIAMGYIQADITGDGVAESSDYSIMENNVNAIRFTQHP